MAVNSIGPFTFIELSTPPDLVEDQIALHARAGVDGNMLQNLGTRGEPFEMESLAGVISYARAWELAGQYKQLAGSDAVQVIWSDFALAAGRHLFFVLNVRIPPRGIYRIVRGHGPEGDYFAEIRAVWRMVAVRV